MVGQKVERDTHGVERDRLTELVGIRELKEIVSYA